MRGIVGWGAHVPHRRLDRTQIAPVAGTGGGKGTRAVASYDEDSTTMAVEAARACLASVDVVPDSVWFATTSPGEVHVAPNKAQRGAGESVRTHTQNSMSRPRGASPPASLQKLVAKCVTPALARPSVFKLIRREGRYLTWLRLTDPVRIGGCSRYVHE